MNGGSLLVFMRLIYIVLFDFPLRNGIFKGGFVYEMKSQSFVRVDINLWNEYPPHEFLIGTMVGYSFLFEQA